jgi:hypothetical protein
MPSATMHSWRQLGWVRARKLAVPGGHWALWADKAELKGAISPTDVNRQFSAFVLEKLRVGSKRAS